MRPINKVLIHCTATPEGRDVSIKEIRKWHTDKGWSDIGYHYVIEINGDIKKGRPIELIGSHCIGQNKFSISICYVGGMDAKMKKPEDTRTDEQKTSIVKLIKRIRKDYPNIPVHGHNEYSSKACPSFNVADEGY